MNKLGELMMTLFPGIRLQTVSLEETMNSQATMTLEFTGSWQVLTDPEGMLDPAIRRILRAERSASEMREDKDND